MAQIWEQGNTVHRQFGTATMPANWPETANRSSITENN
jgi:hypothetical protein